MKGRALDGSAVARLDETENTHHIIKMEPRYIREEDAKEGHESSALNDIGEMTTIAGSFDDHRVKEELVLGPEPVGLEANLVVHDADGCARMARPDLALKDCFVALKRMQFCDTRLQERNAPQLIKEEPACEREIAGLKAELCELYDDHVIKDEMVLGPERHHRPDVGLLVQEWALGDADGCPQIVDARGGAQPALRECSVRLERLKAMNSETDQEKTLSTPTTHTDSESTAHTDDSESDIEEGIRGNEGGACNICGAIFSSRSVLKDHVMTHIYVPTSFKLDTNGENETHGNSDPCETGHVCDICEKTFPLKSDLMEHVAVHIYLPDVEPEADVNNEKWALGDADGCPQVVGARGGAQPALRECSVRLERLKAMNSETDQEKTLSTPTTHTDNESTAHTDDSESDIEEGIRGNEGGACNICGAIFSSRSVLKDHVMIHIYVPTSFKLDTNGENETHGNSDPSETGHVCDICKKTFPLKSDLMEHVAVHIYLPDVEPEADVNNEIPDKSKHSIRDCWVRLERCIFNAKRLRGTRDTEPYACDICSASFRTKHLLVAHIKMHLRHQQQSTKLKFLMKENITSNKRFNCKMCENSYTQRISLYKHMRQIHSGQKYLCEICNKAFLSEDYFKTHSRIHTGEKLYSCKMCKKEFPFRNQLKSHEVIHSESMPHTCEVCNIKFRHLCALTNHRRTHTGEKPYPCLICKKQFGQLSSLNKHKLTHSTDKPYCCSICKKAFRYVYCLRKHIKVHSGLRPFSCEICKKSFTRSEHLTLHKRWHTGQKPYTCDICKKKFTQLSNLKTHKVTHTGERPYSCKTCGKRYTQSSHLKRHILVHTGVKSYSCDICDKAFVDTTGLRSHKRTHAGEKPFSCETCSKRFTHRSTLTIHIRQHTGETPYFCEICLKQFKNPSSLRNHIRTHTKHRLHKK